jgi:hypothetical protein
MTVEKREGIIITVVKALVSRQDTLEVPVKLFSAKNRHTASSPVLERVSPPLLHCRFGKKNPAGWNPLFEG